MFIPTSIILYESNISFFAKSTNASNPLKYSMQNNKLCVGRDRSNEFIQFVTTSATTSNLNLEKKSHIKEIIF
jgi:hypothetical protein